MASELKSITKKSQDISAWYTDVIEQAQLAEHGPVKGTMILRPKGFAIWESIQKNLDLRIKDLGAQNSYFPLFIPYSFLQKEKEHVEGFSPELAIVTHAGGEDLKDPLVVRPTSETIMYNAFSRWIQSFRDLPLSLNQWNNVVRWEKRPYLFIRSTEFLWQEGHTAHESEKQAQEMAEKALNMYSDFYQTTLSLFGYAGRKSETEKFPGAKQTLTYEILMPDGKVIQSCTSHNLGQNFAKVFDVQFQNKEGKQEYVHQTSWGLSFRSVGAMILAHGDDYGLVLPPMIASTQVIIIPIVTKGSDEKKIHQFAGEVFKLLESYDVKVRVDDNDKSPGWKFNQYELEGVPLRLEIGAKEMETSSVRVVRRDNKESVYFTLKELVQEINGMLEDIQKQMLEKHKKFTQENTREAKTYPEFKEIMNTTRGFIEAFWCEDAKCEEAIKQETKATTRCLPMEAIKASGTCVYCGKPAQYRWLFGQSY